jgi:ribonuclease-3
VAEATPKRTTPSKKNRTEESSAYALPQALMNPLEARIGYKFRNSLLLAEALTHPSLSLERRDYPFDNQRLEFLGDSVIQLVITEHLYRMFSEAQEGELTKLRTRLVSRQALKLHAQALDLGAYLMMGRGEEASGGRNRDSTLADAFESLVGAIYLDGGFEAARRFLLVEAEGVFAQLLEAPEECNPKGRLQEMLQSLSPSAPSYELIEQTGPEHAKIFLCRVVWQGMELGRGQGANKKEAEVAAANLALQTRSWEAPESKSF